MSDLEEITATLSGNASIFFPGSLFDFQTVRFISGHLATLYLHNLFKISIIDVLQMAALLQLQLILVSKNPDILTTKYQHSWIKICGKMSLISLFSH